jgi:hypothetical protein
VKFQNFSFGSIRIDGTMHEHDIVIDRGDIRKRKKKPSKQFRDEFGHTPLSVEEKIPWKCRQLVIGTGAYGKLPVMEVKREAERRKMHLVLLPDRSSDSAAETESRDDQRNTAPDLLIKVTCNPGRLNQQTSLARLRRLLHRSQRVIHPYPRDHQHQHTGGGTEDAN